MERIKPIELEHIVIPKRVWGYDTKFVDKLLNKITKELENLLKELNDSSEMAKTTLHEVEGYRTLEGTLKDALILAQKTADETRAQAHKEAQLIVQEALQKSENIENKIRQDTQELTWKIDNLKQYKKHFEQRWEKILEEQLLVIKNFSDTEINTQLVTLQSDEQP